MQFPGIARFPLSLARLVAVGGLLANAASIGAGHAAPAHQGLVPASLVVHWLSVDPRNANRLYLSLGDPNGGNCGGLPLQSMDGGSTWTAMAPSFSAAIKSVDLCGDVDPFIISPSGYIYALINSGSRGSGGGPALLLSRDGNQWAIARDSDNSRFGANSIAVSPTRPTQLYAMSSYHGSPDSGAGCDVSTYSSDDSGSTWLSAGGVPKSNDISDVVADPADANTFYANLQNCSSFASVGVTANINGTPVGINPPGLTAFWVTTDSHEPGMIVGITSQTGIPADRRYLSSDQGRSWHSTTCPGDRKGACPAFTVDNVFGAGSSYAFVNDGIYAFQGAGPAEARLAVSARLPVPIHTLVDVKAGTHAGNPVYLLAQREQGTEASFVYRSTDAGSSWQLLSTGLPNAAPPSGAPGALLVKATRHSVAPAFVPAYHTLGLRITGYPLSEAYLDHGALVQIFEHLQLAARGTSVTIGDLGRQVLRYHLAQHDPALQTYQPGGPRMAPIAATPTLRYFPQTHHTLRGDLLRFWQQHGGAAVFGSPLTEEVTEPNGDGSGRSYTMQYFERARLELHPENSDPHFRVELGLLGTEALLAHGWLDTQP